MNFFQLFLQNSDLQMVTTEHMINGRTFHALAYATERLETPDITPTASEKFQATQTVVISLPDKRLLVVPLDDETMQEFVPWAEEAAIMICEWTE